MAFIAKIQSGVQQLAEMYLIHKKEQAARRAQKDLLLLQRQILENPAHESIRANMAIWQEQRRYQRLAAALLTIADYNFVAEAYGTVGDEIYKTMGSIAAMDDICGIPILWLKLWSYLNDGIVDALCPIPFPEDYAALIAIRREAISPPSSLRYDDPRQDDPDYVCLPWIPGMGPGNVK